MTCNAMIMEKAVAKAKNKSIEIRQGAAGPHAYVGKSRIRVVDVAVYYGIMLDELVIERLQRAYPHLTVEQIRDAIDYWRSNKDEIEREIEADEAALANIPSAG
jgi:uncharacterized protein (DUF433 family)